MRYLQTFVALAIAAVAPLAAAQTAASAPPSSPAKKAFVAKILKLQQAGIEGVGNQIAGQTAQQIIVAAGQALQRMPTDKREATAKDIDTEVRRFHDETAAMLRASAVRLAPGVLGPALEERFTEDELKTLVAWLESPVSRKYQQFDFELGQALTQKVVADNRGAVEPKLQALQASLAKKLGSPPPAVPASASVSGSSAPKN